MQRLRIVIDTREGQPFRFDPDRTEVEHSALETGDYSLSGCETLVAVERKTLEDFTTSLIRRRERFLREVGRLSGMPYRCIVVEADLADIIGRRYRSGAHPQAILGATISLLVDYGVPVCFCSDRQSAVMFTEQYLRRVQRKLAHDEPLMVDANDKET